MCADSTEQKERVTPSFRRRVRRLCAFGFGRERASCACAQRGFAIAPILYLLTLVGVATGVLFSSYTQILRTNVSVTNETAVKSEISAGSTTLSASAVLSADQTIFCPPGATPSELCPDAPQKMMLFADIAEQDVAKLPANYAAAQSTGDPKEVGVLAAGAGVKVLDPWGHYYIYCRWENARSSPGAPAMALISAGSNARIETGCGDNSPSGDDQISSISVGAATQKAAVWQMDSDSSAVTFGATGSKVVVGSDGTLTARNLVISGGGRIQTLLLSNALGVGSGGTGSSSASGARVNLGATTVGDALFTASSQTAALSTLGATDVGQYLFSGTSLNSSYANTVRSALLGAGTVGDSLFTQSTASGARGVLGAGSVGENVFTAGTQSAALSALGAGSVGEGVFVAGTADSAQTALGFTAVGKAVTAAVSQSAARSALGSTSIGDTLFTVSSQAAAWNALGLTGGSGTLDVAVSGTAGSVPASGIIGTVGISQGGTSATTAPDALDNLFSADDGGTETLHEDRIKDASIDSSKLTSVVASGTYGTVVVDSAGRVTGGAAPGLQTGISNGAGTGIDATATGLIFSTASSTTMVLDTSGNLGLGTAAPGERLHVQAGNIRIAGAAETTRELQFATGTDSLRWTVETNAVAEGGADTGSNFEILRYSDAGVATTALAINRATGASVFNGSVSATGGFLGYFTGTFDGNFAGTVSGNMNLGTNAASTNPRREAEAGTGLFSDATNNVAIATDGVERFRISDTDVSITIGGVEKLRVTSASVDIGSTLYGDLSTNRVAIGTGLSSVTAGTVLDLSSNTTAANSSVLMPQGTTDARPTIGVAGMIRYNTTNAKMEVYQAGAWTSLVSSDTGEISTDLGTAVGSPA
ncbi:MAG: beta strand repeat-containing protein, partial [Bdellovibrionales bacterium]